MKRLQFNAQLVAPDIGEQMDVFCGWILHLATVPNVSPREHVRLQENFEIWHKEVALDIPPHWSHTRLEHRKCAI